MNLGEGENEVARAKLNPAAIILPLLVLVIGIVMWTAFPDAEDWFMFLAVVLMVGGALASINAIATRLATSLVLTDQRLIAQTGSFRRQQVTVPIQHVDRVQVKQNAVTKLLGYGTLTITARGEGNLRVPFRQISRPNDLAKHIRTQMTARSRQMRATVDQS